MEIRCKSVVRTKNLPWSAMRDDGKVREEFKELYLKMLRSRVTMNFNVQVKNRYFTDDDSNELTQFGKNLTEFCDTHCKGLWSQDEEEPKVLQKERDHLGDLIESYEIIVTVLFEEPEDADYFMKHYALIQKLTY